MSEVARSFGLLHITGTGKTSGTPDRVVVNFEVNALEKTQTESTKVHAKKFAEAKKKLAAAGAIAGPDDHKNLCSTGYSCGAEYEYVSDRKGGQTKKLVGFKTVQSVALKLSLEQASAAIDALASCEAEVAGVVFEMSNYAELRKQALDLAIKNAKVNAKSRAEDLGVPLDLANVYDYVENTGGGISYKRSAMAAPAGGGGPAPDLAVGEMDVTVSVSVTYAVEMRGKSAGVL